MKKAFEVKQKTFFLVTRVLSFRYTRQTSKIVADTTFKYSYFSKNYIYFLIRIHSMQVTRNEAKRRLRYRKSV